MTSDPTAKITSAATSTGTRPRRSAIRPINGSMATYPSRKPLTIGAARCNWSTGTPVLPIISGSARTTTYVSAAANATATAASPEEDPGRPSGAHGAVMSFSVPYSSSVSV